MKQIISIRLESELIEKLKKRAEKEDRTLSNLIGMLLKEGMQEEGEQE